MTVDRTTRASSGVSRDISLIPDHIRSVGPRLTIEPRSSSMLSSASLLHKRTNSVRGIPAKSNDAPLFPSSTRRRRGGVFSYPHHPGRRGQIGMASGPRARYSATYSWAASTRLLLAQHVIGVPVRQSAINVVAVVDATWYPPTSRAVAGSPHRAARRARSATSSLIGRLGQSDERMRKWPWRPQRSSPRRRIATGRGLDERIALPRRRGPSQTACVGFRSWASSITT